MNFFIEHGFVEAILAVVDRADRLVLGKTAGQPMKQGSDVGGADYASRADSKRQDVSLPDEWL